MGRIGSLDRWDGLILVGMADAPAPGRGWAWVSVVLGAVSVPTCGGVVVGGLLGIGAGIAALARARGPAGTRGVRAAALAGLVLSGLSLVPPGFLWSQYWIAGRRGEKVRATLREGMTLAEAILAADQATRERPTFQVLGSCPGDGTLLVLRRERTFYFEQMGGMKFSTDDEADWARHLRATDFSPCTRLSVWPAPGARFGIETDGRRVTRVTELVVRFRD